MVSPLSGCLSTETDVVDSLDLSELQSETEADEQSEETTDIIQ